MVAYIIRRLIQGVIVIIIASIMVFLVMRLLPSDPALLYISELELKEMTPEMLQELRAEFGIDKSLPAQYFDWISNLIRGDFGRSIFQSTTVGTLLAETFPITTHTAL